MAELAEVAPLAGAWIETPHDDIARFRRMVAPLAGAWIETVMPSRPAMPLKRRAPRGRVD